MTYRELTTKLQGLDDLTALKDAEEKAASIDFNDLYWDIFDGGMCGDDVMAWNNEAESINDDGQRAVIRVQLEALK